jgi:hypothetical protein
MAAEKSDPAQNVAVVTPGASPLAQGTCKALYITSAGDLSFTARGGGASGTIAVTAGQVIPVEVSHVLAATTAGVLALY